MAPGDRSAEKRAQLRDQLIDAAERRVAAAGTGALKARDLAQDIGVALGAIYNLVADLDELALLVAQRTLIQLDTALEQAAEQAAGPPPAQLKAIASAYLAFARAHPRLWRNIFYGMPPDMAEVPQWIVAQQQRMFRHILNPLEALRPHLARQERLMFAHTLFSATHGIVQLSLEQRFFAVPADAIDQQLGMLVDAVCAGLPGGS
jgi:AcrR family transcriptional regulator